MLMAFEGRVLDLKMPLWQTKMPCTYSSTLPVPLPLKWNFGKSWLCIFNFSFLFCRTKLPVHFPFFFLVSQVVDCIINSLFYSKVPVEWEGPDLWLWLHTVIACSSQITCTPTVWQLGFVIIWGLACDYNSLSSACTQIRFCGLCPQMPLTLFGHRINNWKFNSLVIFCFSICWASSIGSTIPCLIFNFPQNWMATMYTHQ